jgi:hypothetical protein
MARFVISIAFRTIVSGRSASDVPGKVLCPITPCNAAQKMLTLNVSCKFRCCNSLSFSIRFPSFILLVSSFPSFVSNTLFVLFVRLPLFEMLD